jgi:hypothetical protein
MYIIYASKHNGKPPHLVDGQNPLVILAEPGFEKIGVHVYRIYWGENVKYIRIEYIDA